MIIADTGFFFALANQDDTFHGIAIAAMAALQEPLITTHPILTETCYLLMARGGSLAQSAFLRSVAEGFTDIFTLGSPNFLRMAELIEQYRDLPMDMADASLVVLAEQLGHGRFLTVDRRDFNVYRWSDRNSFENWLIR
jgi:predicted nucleic acid-binding protein